MFKKQVISVVLVMFLVLSISIDSKAAYIDFSSLHTEPTCSDTSGYVVLACRDNSGQTVFRIYAWTIVPNGETDSFPTMDFELRSSQMWFTAQCVGNAHLTLWELYADGGFQIVKSTSFNGSLNLQYDIYTPVGYSIKGNYGIVPTGTYDTVSVYWASEKQTINYLMFIYSTLQQMQTGSNSSNEKLNEICLRLQYLYGINDDLERLANSTYELLNEYMPYLRAELQGVNEELDRLYDVMVQIREEQEETNTWLEKIFNFLEEKDEKDKEAATQQGNQSSKDVSDMIQDDSEGFKDSLGGLTASMSYSGTDCSWSFPTVKLPAIPGVMDEVTLIKEQDINFSYWVNSLPSFILLLVQSVCTAALIVFCFKELYGAISYVLTLKGGGNSE